MADDAINPLPPGGRKLDWAERNWKWFLPLLCLVALIGIGGFAACIFKLMKSSDAYLGAVARARAAPAVVAALGTPIDEGFFVTGSVNLSGASGKAELAIPLSGPSGSATEYVAATKSLGEWHFDELVIRIDKTGARIDLSEKRNEPDQPPRPRG